MILLLFIQFIVGFEITCTTGNPANPLSPEIQIFSITGELAPLIKSKDFLAGTVQVKQIVSKSNGQNHSSILIPSIPCRFSTKSEAFSCSLVEFLEYGRAVTAQLDLAIYQKEKVSWHNNSLSANSLAHLMVTQEFHFIVKNKKFRNSLGQRQPISISKVFKKSDCQVMN